MTESGDEPVRLGDRYELGGLLGRGGMADVRVARDLRLGRTVAIKQLRTDLSSDDTFQERFRREAQAAASLNHPSIVAVYDTGEAPDKDGHATPYIVMEYVEGQTLRDIMRDGRKILPERALDITADVLSAIDYSHRSGIVHRDIKPANVMLTPSGQVKVMDFGIARAIADASSAMTQTAAVIGTAQYLSPEQARGETVDARSDIYSTGCLLYELLTGRPPFVGDSPVSVAYQHVREEARPPSQLNPDVTEDIDRIVAKSLAKRVDDRYQSAADMREDIERFNAGHQIAAPDSTQAIPATTQAIPAPVLPPPSTGTTGTHEAVEEESSGGKGKWWALGVLVLILLGVAAFALINMNKPAPTPDMKTVPNVMGKTQDAAKRALTSEGLKLGKVTEESSENVEKGQVAEQTPKADDSVKKGTKVDLVISTGPELVTIPTVVGRQYDQAKDLLEGDNYKLKVTKKETDSERPQGEIVNSNPVAGENVSSGSKITLFVSKGQVTVPNVVGMTEDDAKKALGKLKLKASTVQDPGASKSKGTVIDQSYDAGEKVDSGTKIVLTVSAKADEPTPSDSPSPSPPSQPSPPVSTPGG